jgi:hypothetical protein
VKEFRTKFVSVYTSTLGQDPVIKPILNPYDLNSQILIHKKKQAGLATLTVVFLCYFSFFVRLLLLLARLSLPISQEEQIKLEAALTPTIHTGQEQVCTLLENK